MKPAVLIIVNPIAKQRAGDSLLMQKKARYREVMPLSTKIIVFV